MPGVFSLRRITIVLLDILAVAAAYVLAFYLRFDFSPPPGYVDTMVRTAPYALVIYAAVAQAFSLYAGLYRYSSFQDLIRLVKSVSASAALAALVILFVRQGRFPRAVLMIHPILVFLAKGGLRFSIRWMKTSLTLRSADSPGGKNVLLIGAGDMGELVLRQMLRTPDAGYCAVGFIDDDPAKHGKRIHDVPVLGGRSKLAEVLAANRVDEVIISIASQRGDIVRSTVEALRGLEGVPRPELKIAPSLDEMLVAPGQGLAVRGIKPADLLNRGVVKLDSGGIARLLRDKRVLVSGAGGSIGAELCRQALKYSPKKLILLENHANSLFYCDKELGEKTQGTEIVPVLGDIRDAGAVEKVFAEHKPEIVLHAAAHKHVHQLESNVAEAVGNNVLGTHVMAAAADRHRADVFLLISTDKAVRPASVMGATKMAAERVVRGFAADSGTRFATVRFGNVLGSSGSVFQIFEEQIAKGGPVTVTDERATRYFMVLEEAIGLVLQAASMAKGGEVFILRMGTPVRIHDMAKNLVVLHGLQPGRDIEIKLTGLKQGEKLDEELVEDPARMTQSGHPDIMVLGPEQGDGKDVRKQVQELEALVRGTDASAMLRKLQELVPAFKPAPEHRL